jgi:hypothetical protein
VRQTIVTGIFVFFASFVSAQRPIDTSTTPPGTENENTGWSNQADVGIVFKAGNSSNSSLHFDNSLRRIGKRDIWLLRFGGLRTRTTDDRYAVGSPGDFEVVEDTARDLDSERYYAYSRYDRRINSFWFWMAGGGWERDLDAGIVNQTTIFGGVGNVWLDRDNVRFRTDYAVTITSREDEIPDPQRDSRYSEARLSWDFMQKFGKNAQFDSDFIFTVNVGRASDNHFNTISSITSALTDIFSLRASLRLIHYNLPALEELDLSEEEGGDEIGTVLVRKKKLDSIVKLSLVITF